MVAVSAAAVPCHSCAQGDGFGREQGVERTRADGVCRNDGVRPTAAARVLCSRSCGAKAASWVGVRVSPCSGHGRERDGNVRGHGGAGGG
jgi:hypothetical protein